MLSTEINKKSRLFISLNQKFFWMFKLTKKSREGLQEKKNVQKYAYFKRL